MTTNQDRAAEIIRDARLTTPVYRDGQDHITPATVARLADAGLLAPDALPPLDFYDDCGVWPINAHPDQYVEMRVTGTGRRLVEMHAPAQMEPLTALRLAAALIAAAAHAEKEKK